MTEKINLSTVTYVAIHMNLVFIGIFTQRIMILFSHKRAEKSNDNSTNNIFCTRNSSIAKMEQPNQPQYQNWRKVNCLICPPRPLASFANFRSDQKRQKHGTTIAKNVQCVVSHFTILTN